MANEGIPRERLDPKPGDLKRKLTVDEMKDIAGKQYKNPQKGGPKTPEGKMKSLNNLGMQAPKEVDVTKLPEKSHFSFRYLSALKILNEDELALFKDRWGKYYDEFELNESADDSMLYQAIMAEISIDRLFREQLSGTGDDDKISDQIYKLSKVHAEALKSLGTTRKDRLGAKGSTEENIASIIASFDKEQVRRMMNSEDKYHDEEEELATKKRNEYMRELADLDAITSADAALSNEDADALFAEYQSKSRHEEVKEEPSEWDIAVPVPAGGEDG